jgi:hypothetical protein
MASVAQTHAAVVYSDDFTSNPFTSAWTQTFPGGSYDLQWTGNSAPSTINPGLPANANSHSVYSFSTGGRTMSTVNTSVPAGVTGWTEMTYSLNFQMGGGGTNNFVDNNAISVLANRSGNDGYNAAIYTGGDGNIMWTGAYTNDFSGYRVVANTWYTFKTTLNYDAGNIQMFSQILDLNGNDLAMSATLTFNNPAYLNPNGFQIGLGNYGGYWNHATQIDNFVVTAVPEPSTYALVLGGIATLLLIRRRVQS